MELKALLDERGLYSPMKSGAFNLSNVYGYGELVTEKVDWTPDFDLEYLFQKLGGTIHYIDYADFRLIGNMFENSLFVKNDHEFDILLPAYADISENRFTLAHELGHYFLHGTPMTFACRKGDTPVEKEADCFALGFLMPSEKFKIQAEIYNVSTLACAFLVPDFAVRARLRSLDLSCQ
jgi:Zn-dependent peptidase ImmA (M78 family)